MQKIAACVGGHDIDKVLASQNPGGWVTSTGPVGARGHIGLIAHPRSAHARASNLGAGLHAWGGSRLAVVGTPLGTPPLEKVASIGAAVDALCRADGTFAAIGWDDARRRLLLVTDPLGLRPLHLRVDGGNVLAASDEKAFPYAPDPAGWAAFVRCGELIGRYTLSDGVERLKGGRIVSLDPVTGARETQDYWRLEPNGPPPQIDDVVALLEQNARDYAAHFPDTQCLVSGGYDSRLIAFTLDRIGVRPTALTVSHRDEYGDLDGRLAARLAGMAGLRHQWRLPDPEFFSSRAYLDYVWYSEGVTPSLYLFIAQVAQFIDAPATWEGNLPAGLFKSVRNPGGLALGAFADTMLGDERTPSWQAAAQLFRSSFVDAMREGLASAWRDSAHGLPDSPYGTWAWVVQNHMRTRTGVNPYRAFANRSEVLSLGASQALWQAMARVDPKQRLDDAYMRRVLKRVNPKTLSLPLMHGEHLVPPERRTFLYAMLATEMKLRRTAERRPGVGRWLRLSGDRGFPASRFLTCDAVWDEEDPLLDLDALRRLRASAAVPRALQRLLFHWRAARWVREGRLHATLGQPGLA